MRIIAGSFKGRRLVSARDRSIRPTTDRAKQTIFDILSARIDFSRCSVLDLFSGSGSLGLEALSRGASHVTFVERSRQALAILERNIRELKCEDQTTVHQADVFWYLKNARHAVDIVFVDPPYKLEQIGELPAAVASSPVSAPGTFVVMEHSRESSVPIPESYEAIRKSLGQTVVLILRTIALAA
jgi:16S rRNA (guanine966-N2)-methyltransferase